MVPDAVVIRKQAEMFESLLRRCKSISLFLDRVPSISGQRISSALQVIIRHVIPMSCVQISRCNFVFNFQIFSSDCNCSFSFSTASFASLLGEGGTTVTAGRLKWESQF